MTVLEIFKVPISLWHDGLPSIEAEADNHEPTLQHYFQEVPGAGSTNCSRLPAVIICPGGAYGRLASHEGEDYAKWLVPHGVACFVLRYRLGSDGHRFPDAYNDLARAVRLIRYRALALNIDANRIAVMGSSAGGHLVSTLLVEHDDGMKCSQDPINQQSCKPNIGVLCYPLISMEANIHAESRTNLLGNSPTKELSRFLSTHLRVTSEVPPCFIWHTRSDRSVKVEHSLIFAGALSQAGVPFELHIYETGGHGLGLRTTHPWPASCIVWLQSRGFLTSG